MLGPIYKLVRIYYDSVLGADCFYDHYNDDAHHVEAKIKQLLFRLKYYIVGKAAFLRCLTGCSMYKA